MKYYIFRQYDVRGIIKEDIQEEEFGDIARGFCTILKNSNNKKIAIGMDGRLTSPEIKKHAIRGIEDSGFECIDIGTTSTPALASFLHLHNIDNGIMITASHNPKEYNGMKFFVNKECFFGENISLHLKNIVINKDFIKGNGQTKQYDFKNEYIQYITQHFNLNANSNIENVVFDCGNGAVCSVINNLTQKLKFPHKLLFDELNGHFPNHAPDPSKAENLKELQKYIQNHTDIGFAFDGDGDRVAVCLKDRVLSGEEILFIIAYYHLKEGISSQFVVDILTSNIITNTIAKLGGKCYFSKVGNGFIGQKMKETNSLIGAEMSGHIRINHLYHGGDDGLFAALYILQILQKYDIKNILSLIPERFSTGIKKIKLTEDTKEKTLQNIIAKIKDQYTNYDETDGIRVNLEKSWFCIRKSNTEPVLTYIIESINQAELEKIECMLIEFVKNS